MLIIKRMRQHLGADGSPPKQMLSISPERTQTSGIKCRDWACPVLFTEDTPARSKPYNLLINMFAVCILMLALSHVVIAQNDCPSELEPRLEVGGVGVVLPGTGNNVRDAASTGGNLVDVIDGAETFDVLEGPVCSDGFMWWRVSSADGEGWTVSGRVDDGDYFVMPVNHSLVQFGNTIFDLPMTIADSATGQAVDDEYSTRTPTFLSVPAHTEFTFDTYPDEDYREFDYPRIRIFETEAFAIEYNVTAYISGTSASLELLIPILEEQPDPYETFERGLSSKRIPDDSINVSQIILAHMGYLDFENGTGIRYVTYYAQNTVMPDNTGLLYRFVGLTADGSYFVSIDMPIDAPELLPQDSDADYAEYILEGQVLIEDTAPEDFTPDLTQLDAMVQSLYVGGE